MTRITKPAAVLRATVAVGALLLPGLAAMAQTQPAAAINNQDERINLDRDVNANTDSFKVLRSGDKAEFNRYITKVYKLEHANPYEMLPYLRTAAALERGSVITASVPGADGASNQWIQVNVPDFQLPYMDAAVEAYDVPGFVSLLGDVKFSYRTKHRSAVEVADFIRASTLSADGAIRGDAATNTLYVQDSPSDFKRVFAQIQFYDVPTPQMDLEVSLVELTELDNTSLGLDWDAWKRAMSGTLDAKAAFNRTNPEGGPATHSGSQDLFGFASVEATALASFLNYLVDTGGAEVRSQSRVSISNGEVAKLVSMTETPEFDYVFQTGRAREVLTETPDSTSKPNQEGVTIAIAPNIAMDSALLDISVVVRSPAGVAKNGALIYSQQDLVSTLTVAQNELYKIGGIRRGTSMTERKGFPVLRDIPVIKYLFSNETTVLRETELYLFVRPVWTAPMLPDFDALRGSSPEHAETIEGLLQANPNIGISAEDAAILARYFESSEGEGGE